VLLADQTRPHPFWPSRAPFEHRLQARAHHDHRVLDARQALRSVHLESFGVDVLPLTRSFLRASRSVSLRNRVLRAARVFAASYFLR